jgi:hypothetical protein
VTRPTAAYAASRRDLRARNAVHDEGPDAIAGAVDDQDAVRRAVLALAHHPAPDVAAGLNSYCTRASARTGGAS